MSSPLKLIVDEVGYNMSRAKSAGAGWCARQLRWAGGPGGVKRAKELYGVLPQHGYQQVSFKNVQPGDIYVQTHGGDGSGHTGVVAGSDKGFGVLSNYEGNIEFRNFGNSGFYFRPPKARPAVTIDWSKPFHSTSQSTEARSAPPTFDPALFGQPGQQSAPVFGQPVAPVVPKLQLDPQYGQGIEAPGDPGEGFAPPLQQINERMAQAGERPQTAFEKSVDDIFTPGAVAAQTPAAGGFSLVPSPSQLANEPLPQLAPVAPITEQEAAAAALAARGNVPWGQTPQEKWQNQVETQRKIGNLMEAQSHPVEDILTMAAAPAQITAQLWDGYLHDGDGQKRPSVMDVIKGAFSEKPEDAVDKLWDATITDRIFEDDQTAAVEMGMTPGAAMMNYVTNAAFMLAGVAVDTFTNPLTYIGAGEGTAGKMSAGVAKIDGLWQAMGKSVEQVGAKHFGEKAVEIGLDASPEVLENLIPAVQAELPKLRQMGAMDDLVHGGWNGKWTKKIADHYAGIAESVGATKEVAAQFGMALAKDHRLILKTPLSIAGIPIKHAGEWADFMLQKTGFRPIFGPSTDEAWVVPEINRFNKLVMKFTEEARLAMPDEQFTSVEEMYEAVRRPTAKKIDKAQFARAARTLRVLDKKGQYMVDKSQGFDIHMAARYAKEFVWGEKSMPRNFVDASREFIAGPRSYSSRVNKEVDAMWGVMDEDINKAVFDWSNGHPRNAQTKAMSGVYGRTSMEQAASHITDIMDSLGETAEFAGKGGASREYVLEHVRPLVRMEKGEIVVDAEKLPRKMRQVIKIEEMRSNFLAHVHDNVDRLMIAEINEMMGYEAIRNPGTMGKRYSPIRAARTLDNAMDDFSTSLPGFKPTFAQKAKYKAAGHFYIDMVEAATDARTGVVSIDRLPHILTDARMLDQVRMSESAQLQLLRGSIQMVQKEGVHITDPRAMELVEIAGWMPLLRVSPRYVDTPIASTINVGAKMRFVDELVGVTDDLDIAQRELAGITAKESAAREGAEAYEKALAEEAAAKKAAPRQRPARKGELQVQKRTAAQDRMTHGGTYGGRTKAEYLAQEKVGEHTVRQMAKDGGLYFYLWEDRRLTAKSYDDLATLLDETNGTRRGELLEGWRRKYHLNRKQDDALVDRLVERTDEVVGERRVRGWEDATHNQSEPSEMEHNFYEAANEQQARYEAGPDMADQADLHGIAQERAALQSRMTVEIERMTGGKPDNTAAAIKRGIESNYAVEEARLVDAEDAIINRPKVRSPRSLTEAGRTKSEMRDVLKDLATQREEAQARVDASHELLNQFWTAKGAQRDVEPLLAQYLVPPGVNRLFARNHFDITLDNVANILTDVLQTSWVRSNVLATVRFHVYNLIDNFVVGPHYASAGPMLAGKSSSIMQQSLSSVRGLMRLSIRDLGFLPQEAQAARLQAFEESVMRKMFPAEDGAALDAKLAIAEKWGVMSQGMYGTAAAATGGSGAKSAVGEWFGRATDKPFFRPLRKVLAGEAKVLEQNRRIGAMMEDIPRLGLFFQVLENGGSEKEAAEAVQRGFINYSSVVGRPFDALMSKVAMFWPYIRQRSEQTLSTLARQPGVGVSMYSAYKRVQGGSGSVIDMANDLHNWGSQLVGSERDDQYYHPPINKEAVANSPIYQAAAASDIGKELGLDRNLGADGKYEGFRQSDRIALTYGRQSWIGPDYVPLYLGYDKNDKLKMPAPLRWAVEKMIPTEDMQAVNGEYYIMMRSALSPYELLGTMRRLASKDIGGELTGWLIPPLKAPLDATDRGFPEMFKQLRNSYLFMGTQSRPLVGFAAQEALRQDVNARDNAQAADPRHRRPETSPWAKPATALLHLEGPRPVKPPKSDDSAAWGRYWMNRRAANDYAKINNWRRLFAEFGVTFQLVPMNDMAGIMPSRILKQFNDARIEEGRPPIMGGHAKSQEDRKRTAAFDEATR